MYVVADVIVELCKIKLCIVSIHLCVRACVCMHVCA